MHDMRHGDLHVHSIGAKLAYADTQMESFEIRNETKQWYTVIPN